MDLLKGTVGVVTIVAEGDGRTGITSLTITLDGKGNDYQAIPTKN